MCANVEAHCYGLNLPGHIVVVFSEEKLQGRESSQGLLLLQIVSQKVGMLFTQPQKDPLQLQGGVCG